MVQRYPMIKPWLEYHRVSDDEYEIENEKSLVKLMKTLSTCQVTSLISCKSLTVRQILIR